MHIPTVWNWAAVLYLVGAIAAGPKVLLAQSTLLRPQTTERGIEAVDDHTDQYGNGAAVADYDGDGDLDIYLPTDAGIPDRLYRNDGRGYFTDVAEQVGIRQTIANRTALWFDYDGDHRLDLVVAGENCVNRSCSDPVHLALYRQSEYGAFTEVTDAAGLLPAAALTELPNYAIGGLAAGDVNGDDYLDLLLTVWGGGVQLFVNNADGTFRDGTQKLGLTPPADTPWQALIHDFNGDGRQDILCNVDFEANRLWINSESGFVNRAWDYGLNRSFNEMGIATGDYDNDGRIDLYLTNITRRFSGMNQHNLLLSPGRETGDPRYRESARSLGVSQSGWDWGTSFVDLDGDGWQDLVATNGWWDRYAYYPDSSRAWRNTPVGFVDVSASWGFDDTLPATTVLAFDMDRDGDTDLLQTIKDNPTTKTPAILYENQLGDEPNHLTVQPRMSGANHFAIGSVVTVVADDFTSARLITAGCSFYGQEPAEAHFGLGDRAEIREVRVRWPLGETSIYPALAVNELHTLTYRFLPEPSDLSAAAGDGGIELSWRDNSADEEGFVLHRSADSTFARYRDIYLPADRTTYVDSTATGTTYYYRLRAYAGGVQSGESNAASAVLPSSPQLPPAGVAVYPNPVTDGSLRLFVTGDYRGTVLHRLFDLAGREVWRGSDEKLVQAAQYRHPLVVDSGLYILETTVGESRSRLKLHINGYH